MGDIQRETNTTMQPEKTKENGVRRIPGMWHKTKQTGYFVIH
ncbi:Uncharacterized protein APZ42_027180 [Daphnia magna]|uniref:Uncharacterized protein n=1 Tax=Daphnia magna TaxID=35525 RepID=A0A164RBS7_9CRUS|nr:Uncharacterized protein APZ42_027180 [Daphnia magna]